MLPLPGTGTQSKITTTQGGESRPGRRISMYTVSYKLITDPQNSVDGKRHVRTLYYTGTEPMAYFAGAYITEWGMKRNAYKFGTRREAQRFADGQGMNCTVNEVKGA